jgi:xylose isomerase
MEVTTKTFLDVPVIKYEGPESKNPLSFKYYDADKDILGKKMSEHLPFAIAYWHNMCASGTVIFH